MRVNINLLHNTNKLDIKKFFSNELAVRCSVKPKIDFIFCVSSYSNTHLNSVKIEDIYY